MSLSINCNRLRLLVTGLYSLGFLNVALVSCVLVNTTTESVDQDSEKNVTSSKLESEMVKLQCPLGYEDKRNESDKPKCVKCSLGHFRNSSMEKCAECPPGYEALIEGMKECTVCIYGKYRNDGDAKCHYCPSGSISLVEGATKCQKCPPNFYCPCAICHPIKCATRGFCPEGSQSPLFCDYPLMKRVGPKTSDCALTSELIGLICGAVLLFALLSSVILANIFLKRRNDVVLISADSGSSRYLLQNASSSSDLRYSGL